MESRPVSVVVSSTATNLCDYKPMGEDFENTLDQILSDASSFENSFDEYSGVQSMDNTPGNRTRYREGESSKGPEESLYWPSSRTSTQARRVITFFADDAENDGEDEDDSASPQHPTTRVRNLDDDIKEISNNESMDDLVEEDIAFGSVDAERREWLVYFIASHSFMRERQYPARRSARRRFVWDVREEAVSIGIDDATIEKVIEYTRKTYLELFGKDVSERDGSEFGEEINNKPKKGKKPSKLLKPDVKKNKKSKKKHENDKQEGKKRERIQSSTVESTKISKKSKIGVLGQSVPGPRGAPDAAISGKGRGSESRKDRKRKQEHSGESRKRPRASSENARKHSNVFVNTGNPTAREIINLDSDDQKVGPAKSSAGKRTFTTESIARNKKISATNSSSEKGKGKQVQSTSRETSKKKKNGARPRFKHEKEIHTQKIHRVGWGFLSTDDSRDVTSGDEVRSKYFPGSSKARKLRQAKDRGGGSENKFDEHSIPEATRALLEEWGLTSDFLLSDSTLTDLPSDLDSDYDSSISYSLKAPLPDNCSIKPLRETIGLALAHTGDASSHRIVEQTPPQFETPVKVLKAILNKQPTLNPPKLSHYFPKPLVDPDSCLPFPPIGGFSFGLVQEQLAHDPFRLLLATIFLNRTRGGVALPILFQVFDRFPTVEAMAAADLPDLVSMIHRLGFQNQRAKKCIGLAQMWLERPPMCGRRYRKLNYPCKQDGRDIKQNEFIEDGDPRVAWEIGHLPGVGAYSLDSWRIFCRDELRGLARDWKGGGATKPDFIPEWKSVLPQDKELRAYLTWMWLKEGWVWDRHTGKRTRASNKMMRAARRGGIAHVEEGNWVLEMSPIKRLRAVDGEVARI